MPTWDNLSNLLPITVIAAIVIFLIKETLEWTKRRTSDLMKRKAIRTMLAHEIELNHFAFERIIKILDEIKSVSEENVEKRIIDHLKIIYDGNGRPRIKITRDNGWSLIPIPVASDTIINRHIMEMALVDKMMFERALSAIDSVSQTNHLRDSIIDNVEAQLISDELGFLITFADYGLNEMRDAMRSLDDLYKTCTGKALDRWKVR